MPDPQPTPDSVATPWNMVVADVKPYVARLSMPGGWGTGFLLAHSSGGLVSGVATAAHVLEHAHLWEEPIRIHHPQSGESLVVHRDERAIQIDSRTDTAVMIIRRDSIKFPEASLTLAPRGRHLTVGNEIGWLGFPAIPAADLCFFSGRISAWSESLGAYFVDGNAINGVSGGPAVAVVDGELFLVGVVSAYAPNRATGESLPGLAIVRDVERFHDEVAAISTLDQAKAQETAPSPSPEFPRPEAGENPTRGLK